ncbi:DUF1036 domain-containing protein [Polycladidibacter stylochi]|uniref:DUF1036 domain-containing protein n=1 Tax=Polycladidibacter stylochi TaxID=1807766 RepID=UPI0009EAB92B|nr:DUF1036 domain-containing protein [Pseudovibrio stylochi]
MKPTNDFTSRASTLPERTKHKFGIYLVVGVSLLLSTVSAQADFRLCNKTEGLVEVAVGYRDATDWVSEGWWKVKQNSCETLVKGDLASRYFYIYATESESADEWSGKAYMCVRPNKEFTIHGVGDCLARGYEKTGFFEIDTGEQSSWTLQLTEPVEQGTGGR